MELVNRAEEAVRAEDVELRKRGFQEVNRADIAALRAMTPDDSLRTLAELMALAKALSAFDGGPSAEDDRVVLRWARAKGVVVAEP